MIPLKDDNPVRKTPYATISLIAINTAVFVFQTILGPKIKEVFILKTAAIPYEIMSLKDVSPANFLPPPFTLLTSMFVHGGFFHVFWNMLFLWIFGDNIEDRLGKIKFIIFYLLTGVAASMAHVALNPDSAIPLIGASGAIAGILGAYIVLYPRAKILTLLFFFFFVQVVKIPAIIFLGIWFLTQILNIGAGGGIAWYAHIGGFATGVVLIFLFDKKNKRTKIT
ncbi:MAG TPA: rhomboid family intramembrane serine protease [Thermodesulfobacteriota bacterium]|nr:rhomboid family intramembrane serine protease [Thermodesulfobacteriota bacterium]